ncbi:MAG: DUF401 family protein, partial [Firmicutes bacterium]|nr:DUF401 family protein [Bacillota bacterium]
LAACVALIRILGGVLQHHGLLDSMADSLNRLLSSSKASMMAVPALLGTLPVFGGGIMSAPLVDKAGDRLGMTKSQKAATNLVFRHVVIFFFPFSTMLIFSAAIGRVALGDILRVIWPVGIVMGTAGYLRLLRDRPDDREATAVPPLASLGEFAVSSSPIWAALVLSSALGVPLVIALACGVALAAVVAWARGRFEVSTLWKFADLQSMGAVLGVMMFKDFVSRMDFLPVAMERMTDAGVPPEVVGILGMFVFTFPSGTIQAGIGVTLPLLTAAVTAYRARLLSTCLLYTLGFVFYLVSPVHLCQVLTNRYFGVTLSDVYREYWPVPAATMLAGVLLYIVMRGLS